MKKIDDLFYKNNIYNCVNVISNCKSIKGRKALAEKNPASCPGLSQFMRPTPSFFKCPKCHGDVEIWSDEEEAPCPNCGTVVSKGKIQSCLDWCEFADKCRDLIEMNKKQPSEL